MIPKRTLIGGLAALSVVALGAWGCISMATPVPLRPGASVHFDDWFFTADSLRRTSHLGSVAAPSGQTFYIVEIVVRSEARRVPFNFDPNTVRVTVDGATPVKSSDGQAAEPLPTLEIAPGQTERYSLVFLGPVKGRELRVKFEAGGIGEVLDALIGENREVVFPLVSSNP